MDAIDALKCASKIIKRSQKDFVRRMDDMGESFTISAENHAFYWGMECALMRLALLTRRVKRGPQDHRNAVARRP